MNKKHVYEAVFNKGDNNDDDDDVDDDDNF